jgi:hypothetical protein
MKCRAAIAAFGLAMLLSVGQAHAALIAYWAGDGNADDSVGPNSGTLVDGVTFAPGIAGQAFSFDRTSYVQAPTIGLQTGNADRTLDLWFNVNSYSDTVEEEWLAGYGAFGFSGQAYAILVNHFNISGPAGDVVVFSQWGTGIGGGPAIQTGTWHRLYPQPCILHKSARVLGYFVINLLDQTVARYRLKARLGPEAERNHGISITHAYRCQDQSAARPLAEPDRAGDEALTFSARAARSTARS